MSSDGLGLAFGRDRLDDLDLDRVPRKGERRLPKKDLAGLGCLLEARGDVDRISRDEGVTRASDDLARVDADPCQEAEFGDSVTQLDGCSERSQRRPRAASGYRTRP